MASQDMNIRHSERPSKSKRTFSPEPMKKSPMKPSRKSKMGKHSSKSRACSASLQEAVCSQCNSSYPISTRKSSNRRKNSGDSDRQDGEQSYEAVPLCNNCNNQELNRTRTSSNEAEKEKYLQEARTFAQSLVDILQDPLAERLYCPEFRSQPCACLQKFVLAKGMEESKSRANLLLSLLSEAKRLSQMKCYNLEQMEGLSPHKSHTIGLGNGQKRSQEFEAFVLQKRSYLRGQDLRLCERATQRVLMYSNNFLHKRLKTEPQRGSRVQRKRGKSALGQLPPIEDLPSKTCCLESCVLMALAYSTLLQQWRQRASLGQAEARRVLAEMLTPCGGGRSNCFKFISMVTGASMSTISKVNDQMKRTGGEKEPPEHGLKKWWQDQAKRPRPHDISNDISNEHNMANEDVESLPAEVEEIDEAVNGIPIVDASEDKVPEESNVLPLATHFTFRTDSIPSLLSQLGPGFIIPSHVLLNEFQKSLTNGVHSKNMVFSKLDLPLVTHPSCLSSTFTIKTSSPLTNALPNSQETNT